MLPHDQRQHAQGDGGRRSAPGPIEGRFHRVERACPNIAVDDAERAKRNTAKPLRAMPGFGSTAGAKGAILAGYPY